MRQPTAATRAPRAWAYSTASRSAAIDSSLAASMNPHVLTITRDAASAGTPACPSRRSRRARASESASFLGHPSVWMKNPTPVYASAIVHELEWDAPVLFAQRGHGGLELVLARGEDAQRVALDLDLDLLELLAHQLVHGLGLLVGDALRDGHALTDGAAERLFDLAVLERLERDLAARELVLEDVDHLLELAFVVGDEHERLVLQGDGAGALLEVVARRDLLLRHVDGVAHLVEVRARHHVERRFLTHVSSPSWLCRS